METKVCTKCGEEKPLKEFRKINYCWPCRVKQIKDYYLRNKETINKKRHDKHINDPSINREKAKQRYKKNNVEIRAKIDQWVQDNKDKVRASNKKWRDRHKDKLKADKQEWRNKNRDRCRKYQVERSKQKKATDINYRLVLRIRERTRRALNGKQKPGSLVKAFGCSVIELKTYLESKFLPGMTWENWATDGWHIDHIVPLSSFDLTDPEQFKKACHYTNLQPLWAEDNLRKGAKIQPTPASVETMV